MLLSWFVHCFAVQKYVTVLLLLQAAPAHIDLAGFQDRDPATLSGGQRARVALMRMLLAEPEALLLDEPFSRLDSDLRHRMRELVFKHARAANLPAVLVTHDQEDAVAAGGEIIHLTHPVKTDPLR